MRYVPLTCQVALGHTVSLLWPELSCKARVHWAFSWKGPQAIATVRLAARDA